MMMTKSNAVLVGQELVRQYYLLLNQAPDSLHKLYQKKSSYVHGGVDSEGRPLEAVHGQSEIKKRVMALNFKDCQTRVQHVDAHATLNGSVVVQVMGELSNNLQPMRKFAQTLILAPKETTENKYYIHNDMLHYQDEVFRSEVKVEDLDESVLSSTTDKESEVKVEDLEESVPSSITDKESEVKVEDLEESVPSSTTDKESEVKVEDLAESVPSSTSSSEPVVTEKKDEVAVIPKQKPEVEKDGEASVEKEAETLMASHKTLTVPPSSKPFTWASVTAKHLPPRGPVPVSAQRPPQRRRGQKPAQDGKQDEKENRRGVQYPDAHQLFVGNIPHDMEKSELKEFFEQYGTVLEVQIAKGEKHPNFGFVVFDNSEPVQNVLGNRPIKLRGNVRLHVDEKKTRSALEDEKRNPKPHVRPGGPRVVRYPDAHQLFVGNIPHDVEKSELKEFFEQYGNVLELKISSGGEQPNFGFVVFENSKPVQNILRQKRINFRGNVRLNVEEKKTRLARDGDKQDPRPHGGPPTRKGVKDQVLDSGKAPDPMSSAIPRARKVLNQNPRPSQPQQPVGQRSAKGRSKQKV